MQKFLTARKFDPAPDMNAIKSVSEVIVTPTPEIRNVSAILSSTDVLDCASDNPDNRINMSSIPIPEIHVYANTYKVQAINYYNRYTDCRSTREGKCHGKYLVGQQYRTRQHKGRWEKASGKGLI
jgi:hypothetical protein